MSNIIGITGKAGAGKDTLAEMLISRGFTKKSFASLLKSVTADIAGEPLVLYHDRDTKEAYSPALGMTRRRALQLVGDGMRKTLGDTVWINAVFSQWDRAGRPPVVIADVRYPNEAEAILAHGGYIVRIVRPDNATLTGEAAAHISEQDIPDDLVTVEITNDGTIAELGAEARKLRDRVLGGMDRGY